MGLIQYVAIAIGVIIISMIILIIKANKSIVKNKPYLFSALALSLIILNWIVYLSGLYFTESYFIIPGALGDYLFIPLWFIVSMIGLVAGYIESKNNKSIAILLSGLALINAIVGMVLWGLSKM